MKYAPVRRDELGDEIPNNDAPPALNAHIVARLTTLYRTMYTTESEEEYDAAYQEALTRFAHLPRHLKAAYRDTAQRAASNPATERS